VSDTYGNRVDATLLTKEGYLRCEGDPGWWMPTGTLLYPTNPAAHFYQPTGAKDACGTNHITYDGYDLMLVSSTDAIGSTTTAVLDYRVLAPVQLTDANANRVAVTRDKLGFVTAFAGMGKAGAGEGGTLADPTIRYEYDLDRFRTLGKPARTHSLAREQSGAANHRWQESYRCADGSGAVVLAKTQAEPGIASTSRRTGTISETDTTPGPRWIGTGRVVRDNKLAPVKQYEPYFSDSPEYDDEPALVELGVTPPTARSPTSFGQPRRTRR
jgi:hypothetical protein